MIRQGTIQQGTGWQNSTSAIAVSCACMLALSASAIDTPVLRAEEKAPIVLNNSAILGLEPGPAKPEDAEQANAEASKKEAEAAAKTAGDDRAKAGDADLLGFGQSKVTAQMNELEERMYRLSEGLKEMEPENASRLMLGLKFAREELILLQMSQTEGLLKNLKLDQAVQEEKQVLAKLDRLKQLLLSDDLDFQLRLERLRMLRQAVKQLEVAIKEEDREQKGSHEVAARQQEIARLRKKKVDLAALIERQTRHLKNTKELTGGDADGAGSDAGVSDRSGAGSPGETKSISPPATEQSSVAEARSNAAASSGKEPAAQKDEPQQGEKPKLAPGDKLAALSKQQAETQNDTKGLAAAQAAGGHDSQRLDSAGERMGSAAALLDKHEVQEAVEPQQQALDLLKQELAETELQLAKAEQSVPPKQFAGMRKDQVGNHRLTDRITEMVRNLEDSGARALGEMIRASGNMQSAEGALDHEQAEPASNDQQSALKSLQLARNELLREEGELLKQLHAEVRKRVLETLTVMLEKQQAVRETTTTLAPAAAKGSRQALASVVGLANSEGEIIGIGTDLLKLIEETGFGIALPAALKVVHRQMGGVKKSLGEGQSGEPVVAAERQIEADLKDLLDAMARMPDTPKQPGKPRRGSRDQERELNRLIAELRMVRLLQIRVNGETIAVDGKRPAEIEALAEDLRQEIAAVKDDQDGVRGTTQRLSDERLQELIQ